MAASIPPPSLSRAISGTIHRLKNKDKYTSDVEIPTAPLPGPQSDGFSSLADELFFGGQAGGGKSFLLLLLATKAHRRSIIYRRTYQELEELEEQARLLLTGTGAKENQNLHTWRNIPGKRLLRFRSVPSIKTMVKYAGRPHDLIAFDELPNFAERQYHFLSGWLRTPIQGQRIRRVSTGNPPTTEEGEWVIRHWRGWLDDSYGPLSLPGVLRWYAQLDGKDMEVEDGSPFEYKGDVIKPLSRTFIPASIDDNPFYRDTGYKAQLQALPEPLRSQLLKGDFKIGMTANPWQVIPGQWVREAQARHRESHPPTFGDFGMGVDVARGGKDQSVLAKLRNTYFYELEKYPGKTTPNSQEVVSLILKSMAIDNTMPVFVDVIGVGAAVYDTLRLVSHVETYGINFANASRAHDKSGKLKFANIRAEAYWRLREALDPANGYNIALPPDEELFADLTAPRWRLTVRGIQIEPKEQVADRIGHSPDCGDAVVLTWFGANHMPRLDYDDGDSDLSDMLNNYRGW